MFRVLWLALLCVVLLAVVATVIGQIYGQKRSRSKTCTPTYMHDMPGELVLEVDLNLVSLSSENPTVHPADYNFTSQRLNGKLQCVRTVPHFLTPYRPVCFSLLSLSQSLQSNVLMTSVFR